MEKHSRVSKAKKKKQTLAENNGDCGAPNHDMYCRICVFSF